MSHILIIDAEEAFTAELDLSLRTRGFAVHVFDDGKGGLEFAKSNSPSLIVLCVELPHMSGYSICNKLKKNADLKGIPLIITSKEATPETFAQHKKLKTRAEEYLIKPFTPDDLLEKISGLITMPEGGDEPADDGMDSLDAIDALGELDLDGDDLIVEEESLDASDLLGEFDADEADAADSLDLDSLDDALDALQEPSEPADIDDIPAVVGSPEDPLSGLDDVNLDSLGLEPEAAEEEEPAEDPFASISSEFDANDLGSIPEAAAIGEDLDVGAGVRQENIELKARLKEIESRLQASEEQMRTSQNALNNASSSSSSSARETLELKKASRAKDKEIGDLNDQILQKEEALVELQEQMDALRRESQDAVSNLASRDAQIVSLTSKVDAFDSERETMKADIQTKLKTAEQHAVGYKKKYTAASQELAEVQQRIDAAEQEAKESGAQLVDAYNRLKKEERLREKACEAAKIAVSLLSGDVDEVGADPEPMHN